MLERLAPTVKVLTIRNAHLQLYSPWFGLRGVFLVVGFLARRRTDVRTCVCVCCVESMGSRIVCPTKRVCHRYSRSKTKSVVLVRQPSRSVRRDMYWSTFVWCLCGCCDMSSTLLLGLWSTFDAHACWCVRLDAGSRNTYLLAVNKHTLKNRYRDWP